MPASSDHLSRLSTHHEPLKGIWQAVKPYTAILREVVNHHSPAPTTTYMSLMASRRVACTHLTMERKYGQAKCMVCRRVPLLGWVYQCTQDFDESSFCMEETGTNSPPMTDSGYASDTETTEKRMKVMLKPWMENAVKEGKYTAEQEAKLRAQRQQVLDTIAKSEIQFEQQLDGLPASLDDISKVQESVPSDPTTPKMSSPQKPKTRLFPHCIQRACHHCRPTFKDRVWQRLEDVFADDTPVEICFEIEQRPLSDLDNVRELGTRLPAIPARSPVSKNPASAGPFSCNEPIQSISNGTSDDSYNALKRDLQATLAPQRDPDPSGFRKSMKKNFKRMLMSRRNSFYQTAPSSPVGTPTDQQLAPQTMDGDEGFDLGLWRQLNDEVLTEAASTRLPGEDGNGGLEEGNGNGAGESEEALALTEEAVDLGTADIIVAV